MENNQTPPAHATTGWWYEEFDDDFTGNEPFIIREAREPAGPDGGVRAIATVVLTDSREDAEATAAFIVRACNAHTALRAASQELYDRLQEYLDVSDAELTEQGHAGLVKAMDGLEAAWRKADGPVPEQRHEHAA